MFISIDATRYELTASEFPISSGQEAVLDALLNVITEGYQKVSMTVLVNQFGFKSALPLISRLDHLIERGRLRVVLD